MEEEKYHTIQGIRYSERHIADALKLYDILRKAKLEFMKDGEKRL